MIFNLFAFFAGLESRVYRCRHAADMVVWLRGFGFACKAARG